jgi:small subunit ribosomal protein S16
MATRIRLRRMGAKKRPFYRVVVADQRSPRDGRFIEVIGKYHPLDDPSVIDIDEAKALDWLRKGAQPSDSVRNLLDKVGIWEKFVTERPRAAVRSYEAGARTRARREEAAKAGSQGAPAAADASAAPQTQAAEGPTEPAGEAAAEGSTEAS